MAFAIMLLVLPFSGLLAEQELRLTPTDDVYTYSNGDIRGMEEWLRTYHSTAGSQYRRITYIKFDISKVPTEVDSVVLRLYTKGWSEGGDKAHQFDVYPVELNTWAEDDLTFMNYKEKVGADASNPLASYVVAAGAAQPAAWLEWRSSDLTAYVTDSAVAVKDLLSFRIREKHVVKRNSNAVVVDFHSKENQSGLAPELVVYSPDGAKPAERKPIIVVHDSTEARLSTILLDGEPLEFFDKDRFAYTVNLPYSATGEPVITATALDTVAKVVVNDKTITCTSADGEHQQTYTVAFQVLPKMDMFLAIGQSNMSGRAPYDDAKEPMEGIYLLTPANGMEISSNPMNKYSNIRKDLSVQRMSPAYQFALSMRDTLAAIGTPRTIGMVVNALGGSSITSWYQPGKSLYDATMKRCKEAAKWGEWKGVIWHQGSADNSQGEKDHFVTYRSQMKKLAENLRQDLGVDTLWFICGELSQRGDHDMFNDTVIRTVQDYIAYSDYVVSEGVSLLSDNTHFDEPGVKLMGLRYAQKILQHVYARPTTALRAVRGKNTKHTKCVVDGQVVVLHQGKKYSLLGTEIATK